MRATGRARIVGAATLVLLCLPLVRLVCLRGPRALPLAPRLVRPVGQRTPSEEALWRARWYRMRAQQAANQERYRLLETKAPEETRGKDVEGWRRRLMAEDRTGDVHRALEAALEAVALARDQEEEYRARTWLVLIECDAGNHREELWQARRLYKLQPRNEISLTSLRHAAQCNGLTSLAQEITTALDGMRRKNGAGKGLWPYQPSGRGSADSGNSTAAPVGD